jgi:hypothetical protein
VERIAVETTAVVVLAEGPNDGAVSHARGHLFEAFIAKVLATQGYEEPRTENLNVTKEGVELDVTARHRVTRHRIVCECKAYSSNVGVPALVGFIGKLALEQDEDPQVHGLFVALPRLTADAREKAAAGEAKRPNFRHMGSHELCELLKNAGLLPAINDGPTLCSDITLVVTEHGIALAAHELDPQTRRASRVVVWNRSGVVPEPLVALLGRSFGGGVPVVPAGTNASRVSVSRAAAPSIVEVRGSTSDFEYQLPAAPKFFIGRKGVVERVVGRVTSRDRAGVLVVNAKSGWGKSSLCLHLQHGVERAGGVALVVDTRTAERPDFVAAALEALVRTAVERGVLTLPEDAAFSSVVSTMETLKAARPAAGVKPLLVVFDQFENVFRDIDLTREFRDLALMVKGIGVPLTVGFSWKTDLVGWTEEHPYRLRDEIRDSADVEVLAPFDAREVETLLRRLEKAIGQKLMKELRQRLREYSQGLPWLCKKLAGHIVEELDQGTTQEQLISQSLNVQSLFESDLARLGPAEQEALSTIAKAAPAPLSEIEDVVPSRVLETLLHQRLVVQVGERIDVYWDTFRDFLINGTVAIEDSYVVRYSTTGPFKLLRLMLGADGRLSVPDAAEALSTSPTVVFNFARELRLFGVLTAESNHVVLQPGVLEAEDPEEAIRAQVATAVRRHKMHSLAMQLIGAGGGHASIAAFAEALPGAFPAVEAKAESWGTYARAFCGWMDYAGLVALSRDAGMRLREEGDSPPARLLTAVIPTRLRSAFPTVGPSAALAVLAHLSDPLSHPRPEERRFREGLRSLSQLEAVRMDARQNVALVDPALMIDGQLDVARLRALVESRPGMRPALASLEVDPSRSPQDVGTDLRDALGADWQRAMTHSAGKHVRAWARACGIRTRPRTDRDDKPHRGNQRPAAQGVLPF